jgi:hypothetical protein
MLTSLKEEDGVFMYIPDSYILDYWISLELLKLSTTYMTLERDPLRNNSNCYQQAYYFEF